jgi:hypothetical protein
VCNAPFVGSAQNEPADLVDILKLVAKGTGFTLPSDEVNCVMARRMEGKVRHRAVILQDA